MPRVIREHFSFTCSRDGSRCLLQFPGFHQKSELGGFIHQLAGSRAFLYNGKSLLKQQEFFMAAEVAPVRSLEYTPTWALAVVCFIIVSVSLALEHSLHLLTNWLKRRKKNKLCDAVYRLQSVLMLLGFLSLLLAVTQEHISKLCVPGKAANIMLPCSKKGNRETVSLQVNEHFSSGVIADGLKHTQYRLLAEDDDGDNAVNDSSTTDSCSAGKVSFMSQKGLQQLHRFIFVLAVMQIVYSVLTMALGRAKMRLWKGWENETQTTEYQVANDPNRFRFTRQTTFGRRHLRNCTKTTVLLWINCFFRQFFNSVAKVDYFTLRHGFISAHLSTHYSNFNFQKYIERTLEEDFKVVVSISPVMWFIVVIFMLLDVHGWHAYLWMSFLPLLIVLVLGTKLEIIVARMALRIQNVIVGTPLVEPNDDLFWFGRPKFVLALLHVTLFMNAFELAFFVWVSLEFGVDSCYHEHTVIIVTRVVLAVTVQVLCSYITLPLYALVTQMGSQFKSKVLEEQIAEILKKWHADVRSKRKKQEQISLELPPTSLSADCSLRSGRGEFSSHSQPTNQSPNRGEIREAEEEKRQEQEIVEVADSSVVRSPPLHWYFQR